VSGKPNNRRARGVPDARATEVAGTLARNSRRLVVEKDGHGARPMKVRGVMRLRWASLGLLVVLVVLWLFSA
jgi:hypothetical protein